MNKLMLRFFALFGISLGFFFIFILIKDLLPVFFILPGFSAVVLPEDSLKYGFLKTAFELLTVFPALILSALWLSLISFSKKNNDLGKIDLKSYLGLSSLVVIFSAFLSFSFLFLKPVIQDNQEDLTDKKVMVITLENAYKKIEVKENDTLPVRLATLERKEALLKRLLILRPNQRFYTKQEKIDYEFEYQILESRFNLEAFFGIRKVDDFRDYSFENKSSLELLKEAEEESARPDGVRDDYRVNKFAFQVFVMETNGNFRYHLPNLSLINRAKLLIDTSWESIYKKTLTADERKRAAYFFRKGKSLGDYQFQNYLEAYYGFKELLDENPKDAEVERYYQLCLKKLDSVVFFQEDLDNLFEVPGWKNVIFKNPKPDTNQPNLTEIIRIGSLLQTSDGIYVKNFELFRIDSNGKVLLHWKAPYGLWNLNQFNFNVWKKEKPEPVFPEVLIDQTGTLSAQNEMSTPFIFKMSTTYKDLALIKDTASLSSFNSMELLLDSNTLQSLGISPLPLNTEFIYRILFPIFFLVTAFYTITLAQFLRKRSKGKPPYLWQLLILLLPVLILIFLEFSSWVLNLLFGFGVTTFGIVGGLGVGITVFLIALASAVYLSLIKYVDHHQV